MSRSRSIIGCWLHHRSFFAGNEHETENSCSFWQDRRGVSAVEFAFVLPIVVMLLGGVFQFGFALFMQGHMSEVARDVSRRVAVGELTQSQAVTFAENSLINPNVTYAIAVTMPDPDDVNDLDILVTISAPLKQISPIDILGLFQEGNLSTAVTRRIEFKE